MNNPKVFEFAKEVGMTPLALMDKIREWQLPVKSHMAELDSELVEIIRTKLNGSGEDAAAAPKKAATRKKAASAAPKKTSTKVPKVAVKATSVVKPKVEIEEASASSKTTVVRRKKAEQEAKLEEALRGAKEESADSISHAFQAPEDSAQEVVNKLSPQPTSVDQEVVEVDVKIEVKNPDLKAAEVVEQSRTTEPKAVAATTASDEGIKKSNLSRKKEVSIGHSGVQSEVTAPVAPKRNIIGRMDLSRVQPPSGAMGGGRPHGHQSDRGGFNRAGGQQQGGVGSAGAGFGARSKGNLRAGFYQAPAPNLEEISENQEFDRKKDEKRRLKGGGAPTEGVAREAEEEVPAFDAAEYRKREMVFQPKKKRGMLNRPAMQTQITQAASHKRILKVHGAMKVSDVAQGVGLKSTELIKSLMKNGVMATINTELDFDTIALIVPEFGFEAQNIQKTAEEVIVETAFGDLEADKVFRPPVVTVMGHVDHGKTSLLDSIRFTNVAGGEAGGITQHIGAYQVTLEDGYKITFLDTPGHEAFTSMRARGANVTDIAIIVVAADDGVMPQTAEAISHAKAANVPMIVAVNKIDKPGANIDRIKQQLTEFEVVPEEWGGTTMFCPVSALKKTGITELLEQIKLQAEVLELKSNPKRSGTGTVIESRLEKGRGSVASILVQDGTVSIGQYIVAGTVTGRVRSLMNDKGERVQEATPGMPVEVLGLEAVPQAGDKFDIVKDEKSAQEVAKIRLDQINAAKNADKKMSLEEIFSKVQKGDVKELAVILKADVAGSLEAIQGMFNKLASAEVKIKIVYAAIGGITENDVNLALTSKGIIIGFNVRPDSGGQAAAKRLGVDVRTYSIVYELIDDMKKAMTGMLTPDVVEKVMGRAEVRNTFNVPKIGTIGGCFIVDGKIARTNLVRLIRDGKIVYEGKIGSLKRFKDDAKEVAHGFECGIGIENYNDLKVGDIIEAYVKEEVARELTSLNAEA